MRVTFEITKPQAITTGLEPGSHTVDIPLQSLSAEDRKLLGECTDNEGRLRGVSLIPGAMASDTYAPIDTPAAATAEAVMAAIRAVPARAAALKAALRAKADAHIANLAAGDHRYTQWRDTALEALFPDLTTAVDTFTASRWQARIARGRAEAARLRAQGRLDLYSTTGEPDMLRVVCERDSDSTPEGDTFAALGHADYYRLLAAARAELDRIKAEAAKALQAKRDAWLAANGGETILAKIRAGYDCAGAVRAHVRKQVVIQIAALVEGLRALDAKDECTQCRDRSCPSDAAFAVEQAAKAAGFGAEVVWATWSAEATGDDEPTSAELVRVFVPCPWDPTDSQYLTIEVTGAGFSD